jgi:lipocalin
MDNKILLILIPILLAVFGLQFACPTSDIASNLIQDPPKTVPYVDVAKYLGAWYEQAVIPFYF